MDTSANVGPSLLRPPGTDDNAFPPDSLDRACRLYRRRVGRCRTENQVNRIHIALENYLTPAEVRHFAAAFAGDPPDSPSRQWIEKLAAAMPVNKARPAEFVRRGIVKGATRYTADTGTEAQKTLLIGLAGHWHRLMLPTPWFLDCLNPALFDVIVLRDYARLSFATGIPGLGGDFVAALTRLKEQVDPRAYRNAIALGTSGGGVCAVMAAIALGLQRGISVSGEHFQTMAARLRGQGLSDAPFAALLASRPHPFPELILAYGEASRPDEMAAVALQQLVPSRLEKVRHCVEHAVLAWHHRRGTLPAYLSRLLGQSLEQRDLVAMTHWSSAGQRA